MFASRYGSVPKCVLLGVCALCLFVPKVLRVICHVLVFFVCFCCCSCLCETGNELGESVIADRQIRIAAMPGISNDDDIPVATVDTGWVCRAIGIVMLCRAGSIALCCFV